MITKEFDFLIGKTLTKVERLLDPEYEKIQWECNPTEMLLFHTTTGEVYKMYHHQDCCEEVVIEDICGDLDDLVGTPIFLAEESCNEDERYAEKQNGVNDGETWTFYRFATNKGYVTIRWVGGSNGWYSEKVEFCELKKAKKQ